MIIINTIEARKTMPRIPAIKSSSMESSGKQLIQPRAIVDANNIMPKVFNLLVMFDLLNAIVNKTPRIEQIKLSIIPIPAMDPSMSSVEITLVMAAAMINTIITHLGIGLFIMAGV